MARRFADSHGHGERGRGTLSGHWIGLERIAFIAAHVNRGARGAQLVRVGYVGGHYCGDGMGNISQASPFADLARPWGPRKPVASAREVRSGRGRPGVGAVGMAIALSQDGSTWDRDRRKP